MCKLISHPCCVTSTNIPLAKETHVANPKVYQEGHSLHDEAMTGVWMEKGMKNWGQEYYYSHLWYTGKN